MDGSANKVHKQDERLVAEKLIIYKLHPHIFSCKIISMKNCRDAF